MNHSQRQAIIARNRRNHSHELRIKTTNWDNALSMPNDFLSKGSGKRKRKLPKPTVYDLCQKAKRIQ